MTQIDISTYQPVFYPTNLAILGASNDITKFGGAFMESNLRYGFKGAIYPINPKETAVQGVKAYASLDQVPEPIDLAVISLPSHLVSKALEECIKNGVKGVEILSAGFREAGETGKHLEESLTRLARTNGVKLIGPNCFGIHSPAVGLTLMPGYLFSKTHGSVGIISQSGLGACDIAHAGPGRGVFFSIIVSFGNGCDIDATELLTYFTADPQTRIVGAYVEGVDNAPAFLKALKTCAAQKPVVFLKGGRSTEGNRATLGHTGSMAGSGEIWKAVLGMDGIISASDFADLNECLMALNCMMMGDSVCQDALAACRFRYGRLWAEGETHHLSWWDHKSPDASQQRSGQIACEDHPLETILSLRAEHPLVLTISEQMGVSESAESLRRRLELKQQCTSLGVPCFDTLTQAQSVMMRISNMLQKQLKRH